MPESIVCSMCGRYYAPDRASLTPGATLLAQEVYDGERERIWFSPHCLAPAQQELFRVGS